MIFQIVSSQTQELPTAGNCGGWIGRQNELCNVTLAGDQEEWVGGQSEFGNVTQTGTQEGWTGRQHEFGNVTLTDSQEGWTGRQQEFGDVTRAMPVMHGPPSCNDDACKAMLSDLQGERDRLGEKGKELSDEVTGLQNVANNLQGERDRLAAQERELSGEVMDLRNAANNLQGERDRLASKERELSGEVMDLYSAAGKLKWKLNKSESAIQTVNEALAETQIELRTAHLTITSLTNENGRLVAEKNSLGRLNTETLKNLNNAYRREKAHKTMIAALKKGILPMENEAEGILTDIEEASGSNTNVMTRKRPGDVISSPSGMKAAKTAKKADVRRGSKGVAPSNLASLSASDKKELPQSTCSVLTRNSTKVGRSPPNQKNIKKVLNNRSQKGDDNDEKMGDMPPEHQARLEVPDHNIPDGGSGAQKMDNMPLEHQARLEVPDHNVSDMNISNEVVIGSPLGSSGSGTQSGERALDPTSS